MTKKELLESSLTDVPDDELLFVVRGSNAAAPETLREYARQVLKFARIAQYPANAEGARLAIEGGKHARVEADAAFAMADRMDANHAEARVAERLAGLTANEENEKLMAEHAALRQAVKNVRVQAEIKTLREELAKAAPPVEPPA